MNKVWGAVGDIWKETKNVLEKGVEALEQGVENGSEKIIPVNDPSFNQLNEDFKNLKIVAKKNAEMMKVLSINILKSSRYSLKIANELVQVMMHDPKKEVQAQEYLARVQKSNSAFHNLADKLIPEYMQNPFVNVVNSLEEINQLRKQTRSYLVEKERVEKRYSELSKNGKPDQIALAQSKLTEADAKYAEAYSQLSKRFNVVKGIALEASKKAFAATTFYFAQFIQELDKVYDAQPVGYAAFVAPFQAAAAAIPPTIAQHPIHVCPAPATSQTDIGVIPPTPISYPNVDPDWEPEDNPYAQFNSDNPQPNEPLSQNKSAEKTPMPA